MKTKKGLLGIVLILSFAFYFISCDITSPQKNIDVIFNTQSISTNASVSFVDAATNSPIGSSSQTVPVNLSFTGPNANKIVTSLDEPLTSTSTSNGIITFGVSSSVTPTNANPVLVTLIASSNGYQTASLPISISSIGSTSYTINMVKISSPPQGSSTAPSTPVQTNSGGQTTSAVTVKTGNEPTSGGSAGLTINTGTGITDASGNSLTGSLTANITYTSGTNASTGGTMPTGLSVSVSQGGTTSQGYLQPAAVASFTITNQNGQLAKNFSTPVTLTMSIPGSTINQLTNVAVKNGDTVPIYSYDESTQTWKFEVNSTAAGPDASGNFTLSFPASHLSFWLSGWILSGGKVCTNNITINITGSYSALSLKLKYSGQTILAQNVSGNQNSLTYKNLTLPKGVPVTIEAYSLLECPATLVGSTTIPDLCSTNTINLNVATPGTVDVNVDVTAECPHKDPVMKIRPSGYDIFVLSPCGNVDLGTLNNGQITLHGLKLNATYTFGVVYQNELYTHDYTVTGTSYSTTYEISDEVCNRDF